nr:MAG TPA: hypothetical protein [Caudoviricetes sp.]
MNFPNFFPNILSLCVFIDTNILNKNVSCCTRCCRN